MIDHIHPSEVAAWIAKNGGNALVLDVREPWEVQAASVILDGVDVAYIPMRELPTRLGELDRQRPVACLCHHGARSLQVASFLSYHGFEQLANITGGIELWATEHDPRIPRY